MQKPLLDEMEIPCLGEECSLQTPWRPRGQELRALQWPLDTAIHQQTWQGLGHSLTNLISGYGRVSAVGGTVITSAEDRDDTGGVPRVHGSLERLVVRVADLAVAHEARRHRAVLIVPRYHRFRRQTHGTLAAATAERLPHHRHLGIAANCSTHCCWY